MRLLLAAALYTAMGTFANAADIATLESLRDGDMRKLRFHQTAQTVPDTPFLLESGGDGTMDQYHGKVVVLNFWATWCAPCREEMPSLDDLSKSNQFENLSVIPINVGREKIDKSINFFKDIKIENLKIFHDSSDELPTKLSLRGIPTTIFVNKDGLEFARVIGSFDFYNSKFIKWLKIYD